MEGGDFYSHEELCDLEARDVRIELGPWMDRQQFLNEKSALKSPDVVDAASVGKAVEKSPCWCG